MRPLSAFADLHSDGELTVDMASYASLQIFKVESHPSAHSVGTSKEGVSLYGLFKQKACAQVGKRLLRYELSVSQLI